MAMDHGKPNQLNSTKDCYLSILPNIKFIENETKIFDDDKQIFKFPLPLFEHYSYIIIGLFIFFLFIILIIITICVTFCLHALFFARRKKYKQKKMSNCSRQFNFYDTVHRKSPFMNDDSGCSSSKLDDNDDVTSEERERLVHLNNSDQTSCESSDSMHKQIRIINKVKDLLINFRLLTIVFRIQILDHYLIIKVSRELFVTVTHPHLTFPQCLLLSFHHVSFSCSSNLIL